MAEVAIVDYGLGNLYSIQSACRQVGLSARITSSPAEVAQADAVILPGVGAFGTAMGNLGRLDLIGALKDFVQTGRPLLGICLGIQLLLEESHEFGHHAGLGLVAGEVVPLESLSQAAFKVPQVGWNRLQPTRDWGLSYLRGATESDFFYFVHSFVAVPRDPDVTLATSIYADITFCSALQKGNIFACQFHPERSGPRGLTVYRNLARQMGLSEGVKHE